MWEWSKTVAEYAAAAAWTRCHTGEIEPTIVDPDYRAEAAHGDADSIDCAERAPSEMYILVG
ncbi:hypothetical protein DFR70_10398 [Nocardia tenerifensis]|uniref:Uncharacterized protein n=1 Tax=Nocardia tenerifensis TaxID=228006 RepID=A0A318K3F9_9NOCA|nr:hypothetical protein [Nocardia tenerifensis]PXX66351.1 hypothetical protein DFR70_10398 [Nocardia tenerifensis]